MPEKLIARRSLILPDDTITARSHNLGKFTANNEFQG